MTSDQRIAAGRLREAAFAAMGRGEINEPQFIARVGEAMADIPEHFEQWLQGYTFSRYEEKR